MSKSTDILTTLAEAKAPMSTADIATAIGETDEGGTARVSALLVYATNHGRVERVGEGRADRLWKITPAGREYLHALEEEAPLPRAEVKVPRFVTGKPQPIKAEPSPTAAHPKTRKGRASLPTCTKSQTDAAALPAAPARVEPVATDTATLAAVTDSGEVLIIERDQVVRTLTALQAQRVAALVNRLQEAR